MPGHHRPLVGRGEAARAAALSPSPVSKLGIKEGDDVVHDASVPYWRQAIAARWPSIVCMASCPPAPSCVDPGACSCASASSRSDALVCWQLATSDRIARIETRPRTRSGRVGALTAVVVLEADDVVELRRGDLHELDLLIQGLEPVDDSSGDATVLPRPEVLARHRGLIGARVQTEPTAQDEDRFVLDPVRLEGQALARLDRDDLADVSVRLGPDPLPAPGLLDDALADARRLPAHAPRTSRSPASTSASRAPVDAASVYTRTSGSVPLVRTSIQEPSAVKNLKPSFVSRRWVRVTG